MKTTGVDVVSIATAPHYVWGADCDGWRLVQSEGLSVIQEKMQSGTAEVRHRHRHSRQFFFVLAGQLTVEAEGVRHAILPRTGIEVPPGAAHEVRNLGADPVEFIVVSQPASHGDREAAPIDTTDS